MKRVSQVAEELSIPREVIISLMKDFLYGMNKESYTYLQNYLEDIYRGVWSSSSEYMDEILHEYYDLPEQIRCYLDLDAVYRDWFKCGDHLEVIHDYEVYIFELI